MIACYYLANLLSAVLSAYSLHYLQLIADFYSCHNHYYMVACLPSLPAQELFAYSNHYLQLKCL
jgi:hypothetical protein